MNLLTFLRSPRHRSNTHPRIKVTFNPEAEIPAWINLFPGCIVAINHIDYQVITTNDVGLTAIPVLSTADFDHEPIPGATPIEIHWIDVRRLHIH